MKTTKNTILEPVLMVDSHHGIYSAQIFVETLHEDLKKQIKPEILEDLKNPENEFYWESWESVLDMEFKWNRQKVFVMQIEDVWIVPACYLRTKQGQEFINAY